MVILPGVFMRYVLFVFDWNLTALIAYLGWL